MLLRLERKGVHVDARGGGAGVVLVGLNLVEVPALTLGEAILAVELDLGDLSRVLALAARARNAEDELGEEVVGGVLEEHILTVIADAITVELGTGGETAAGDDTETGDNGFAPGGTAEGGDTGRSRRVGGGTVGGEATLAEDGGDDAVSVPVIGVVEGLLTERLLDPGDNAAGGRAVHEGITLGNPHDLLDGVVEVHLDLVGRRRDGLRTSELELVDEVLMRLLGKAPALLSIEVHVVDVERGSDELERLDTTTAGSGGTLGEGGGGAVGSGTIVARTSGHGVTVAAVVVLLEVNVDAHFVVLEGDQGDGKTRVAAEPELEGDVEGLHRGAGAGHARVGEFRSSAGGIEGHTLGGLEENEVRGVADHVVERVLSARGLGELGPDLHPVTILAINARTTDLNLNLLDQAVTNVVEPPEAILGGGVEDDLGEGNLDVGAVHEVSVTGDDGSNTTTEVRLTVEGHLNGLHSKVGVALVEHLPEGNLRVAGDVDILGTIRDELHKTASHIEVMILSKKKK